MRKHLTFWEWSKIISPIWARLFARLPHSRPLTDLEIAKASGLTVDRVFIIQHMTNWNYIGMVEAEKFLRGCGVDFCNAKQMDRIRGYIPKPGRKAATTYKYLRLSPEWETKFKPLMLRARKSLAEVG